MPKKLTEEQEKMWERLKHVPRKSWWSDLDANSLYPFQADMMLKLTRGKANGEITVFAARSGVGKSRFNGRSRINVEEVKGSTET